jgi:hypothetical protein
LSLTESKPTDSGVASCQRSQSDCAQGSVGPMGGCDGWLVDEPPPHEVIRRVQTNKLR